MLKPTYQLEKIDNDSDDIYMTSLIDRYSARPDTLENMCLAEFAANYTTRSGNNLEDGETNDTLPPSEDQQTSLLRVQLKNNMGSMYKRSREAIIRFHRFNHEKEADKLYRSKLMLYLPWTDEDVDLLGEYLTSVVIMKTNMMLFWPMNGSTVKIPLSSVRQWMT